LPVGLLLCVAAHSRFDGWMSGGSGSSGGYSRCLSGARTESHWEEHMAQGKFRDGGVPRRNLLQLGALAGASVLIPGLGNIGWDYAQDRTALGSWPAGSEGDTARVGGAVHGAGAYAEQGADELKGRERAVAHSNEGHELMKAITPEV